MTTDTLTCPYCNAVIAAASDLSAGQRIVCPRCGDAFSFRPLDAITHPLPPSGQTAIAANADRRNVQGSEETPKVGGAAGSATRFSDKQLAALIVAGMFVMAGIGLVYMLMTIGVRRAHDTKRPPRRPGRQRGFAEMSVPLINTIAPDKLAALGYLPSGVNFLMAARIAELSASPAGSQLLRDRIALGDAEYRLQNAADWVGLHLEDIDHFVFAAKVGDDVIPPFYLVVRTTRPYEEEAIRRRLQATRLASPSKKKICSFHKGKNGLKLHLWFADESTLILALFADQLEALASQPNEDLQQLPEELRSVLKTRREPVSPVWIAGHSRDWSRTVAGKFLNQMKKKDIAKLSSLRTFGIWIVPNTSLDVHGVCRCADAVAADELEKYFRSLRTGDSSFKSAQDGPWLSLQFQAGTDFLSRGMKH